MSRKRQDMVTAFCHIWKTGGTTVASLLRRNFGIRHMDVHAPAGEEYTRTDMARDFRLQPFAHSVSGHGLRPYVDYGEFEERLIWYTWLSRPNDRYISQYQHYVEKMGATVAFADWLRDSRQWNVQVKWLAGEQDVEAAKQILATKLRCFGLLEAYDESLLLLCHSMRWKNFNVAYGRPRNPAKTGRVRQRIQDEFDKYRDDVFGNNSLDWALYEYAVGELYPRQVRRYGERRLQRDLETEFAPAKQTLRERIREFESTTFHRLVYRPFVTASRLLRRRTYDRIDTRSTR